MHVETIEQLVQRARAAINKHEQYGVTAGVVLVELRARITDKDSGEGEEYKWSWPSFVMQTDLGKGARGEPVGVRQANRLISYVEDPEKHEEDKAASRERWHQSQASKGEDETQLRPEPVDNSDPIEEVQRIKEASKKRIDKVVYAFVDLDEDDRVIAWQRLAEIMEATI